MINRINSADVFEHFKSYNTYQNHQNNNQEISKKAINKDTLKKTAIGAVLVGAALLCAYGIITRIKKGKTDKADNALINEIKDSVIINTKDGFRELVSKLKPDDYDSAKTFRANLHIHSSASDGKLSPLEILNQANNYAQKLPADEKFSFALTDHDSIDGVKEICREIAKNPEKYKKLNFVPGIELSSRYSNPDLAGNPIELDFLIYGFNPENEKLSKEIARRKGYLLDKTGALFKEINKKYPEADFSVKKMRENSGNNQLKNVCSNGYLKALRSYVEDTLKKSGIKYDENVISDSVTKNFNNSSIPIDANIDILNAVKLTKEIDGFSALAHPGKFNFNHANLKTDGLKFSDDIISKFAASGGDGIESYYMSYKPQNLDWWLRIKESAKKLNLNFYKTGGYDTHGLDIGNH